MTFPRVEKTCLQNEKAKLKLRMMNFKRLNTKHMLMKFQNTKTKEKIPKVLKKKNMNNCSIIGMNITLKFSVNIFKCQKVEGPGPQSSDRKQT